MKIMKNQIIITIVIIVLIVAAAAWFLLTKQSPAINDKISDITNDLNQIPNDSTPNQELDSLNQSIQNF